MAEFLMEIGVEELPSGAVETAVHQLDEQAPKLFREARLGFAESRAFGTPRRLVLHVTGVSDRQEDSAEEVKGPPIKAAFVDGKPGPAAEGFARSQGVDVADLIQKDMGGKGYLFAVREHKGEPAKEVLSDVAARLANGLSFPKSMRWNQSGVRFARPVRWLLAFLDDQPVPFALAGLTAKDVSFGHRLLRPGPFKVEGVKHYLAAAKEAKVVLSESERRTLIEKGIRDLLIELRGEFGDQIEAVVNPQVMDEVVQLVEWPSVIWGRFDPAFLSVPEEVLISAMESHQRYFAVRSENGLAPAFIVVHNGDPAHEDLIRSGHERVLGTRLADAKFFFEVDAETALIDKVEQLKTVVFQERLGTLFDKAERVGKVGAALAVFYGEGAPPNHEIERASKLLKADLVTDLVNEFPNLQGVMGRVYARLSGEAEAVSEAVYEHYLPRTAEDALPSSRLGKILSVADKIDTVVGCFSVGLRPTGSEDPYSLRRQSQGIIRILLADELGLSLEQLVGIARDAFPKKLPAKDTQAAVVEFFGARLRALFLREGFAHDTIAAALGPGLGSPGDVKKRVDALHSADESMIVTTHTIFTRCNNLAKDAGSAGLESGALSEPEERAVLEAVERIAPEVGELAGRGRYEEVLTRLASLEPVVSDLFDKVLIVAEDPKVRANRLALLARVRELFLELADFSQIVIEGD